MRMQEKENKEVFYPHVSVDCVLLGINNDKLSVLLVEKEILENGKKLYKLPGSLIYETEDLDTAANRVLFDATGMKHVVLRQFHSFGSPARTKNTEDVQWLENASKMKIARIVTIAYLALCKMKTNEQTEPDKKMIWTAIDQLPHLPFDHAEIVDAAVKEIRNWVDVEPAIVFNYLPTKFTAFQLRRTLEIIYNKPIDVRNFHKKLVSWDYVVPTDELEEGVAHRAARYYRFDKKKYNKIYSKFNKI